MAWRSEKSGTEDGNKGIALVAVIWAISLLSLIAAAFTLNLRSQSHIVRNGVDNAQARAIADAGVDTIINELINPANGAPLSIDGSALERQIAGATVVVTVQDEAGKFDLNRTRTGHLRGVFLALGKDLNEAEKLADAIVDYRDKDTLRRLNGAEDADYRAAGTGFGAKDAPFETLSELRRVMGMTDDLFAASKDVFTVHSRRNRVDRRSASPLVLAVLEGRTDAVLSDAAIPGQDFNDPGETRPATPATGQGAGSIRRGGAYNIRAMATTETGAVYVRDAVVRLIRNRNNPFRILEWQQGSLPESTE